MASMADLLIAASESAPAILKSDYPLNDFRGVNVDGLDPLMLTALHSTLTGLEFDEAIELYRPIDQASESGPWLIELSAELIGSLGHIAPEDLPSLAIKWASTNQLRQAGWSEQEAEQFLGRIAHFGQTAAVEGIQVYLCVYS